MASQNNLLTITPLGGLSKELRVCNVWSRLRVPPSCLERESLKLRFWPLILLAIQIENAVCICHFSNFNNSADITQLLVRFLQVVHIYSHVMLVRIEGLTLSLTVHLLICCCDLVIWWVWRLIQWLLCPFLNLSTVLES